MYDRKGRTPDEGDQANRRKDQRAPEPGVLYNSVSVSYTHLTLPTN